MLSCPLFYHFDGTFTVFLKINGLNVNEIVLNCHLQWFLLNDWPLDLRWRPSWRATTKGTTSSRIPNSHNSNFYLTFKLSIIPTLHDSNDIYLLVAGLSTLTASLFASKTSICYFYLFHHFYECFSFSITIQAAYLLLANGCLSPPETQSRICPATSMPADEKSDRKTLKTNKECVLSMSKVCPVPASKEFSMSTSHFSVGEKVRLFTISLAQL